MDPFAEFSKRLQGYGAKAAPRALVDTITDPQTYRRLAVDAERLLGRNLPSQFAGSNFGNIPTRITGLLNDLSGTSGAQRAVQTAGTNRAIQALNVPNLARTVTQTAEGLLRAPNIGQGLVRQITTRLPEAAQALDPFARDYGLTRELMKRAGGGMQNVAESLLPKQAFNTVGGVGGLLQNLNKVAKPVAALGGLADVYETNYKGSVQQNQLGGLFSPAGAAYGVARMLTGGPFSSLPEITAMIQQAPKEKIADTIGKNYRVGDIEYDNKTGRAINPPPNTFVPDRQNRLAIPPVNPGFMQAGAPNTGAGTQDQRRVIEERNYQTQLSNAKQQYATPDPMSPDFQGYPNELAAQYGLEQAYGQELKQAGTLVPQLQEAGAGAGMTPENFAAWAKANPGLAVRLLSQGQRN